MLALASSLAIFCADPAQAFTYQGELRQFGEVQTQLCDFRLSLADQPVAGQVLAGPTDIAEWPVVMGRFTLVLDSWPDTVWAGERWLEISVACPSGTPLAVLSPRTRVSAAPLAAMARSLAPGSVSTAAIAENAVTSDKIASGAVTTDRIAVNAVTTDHIAPGAITGDRIAPGAVGTAALAPQAVTADRILPGAVNASNVDSASVQLRVSGSCDEGSTIQAIGADGQVSCAFAQIESIDAAQVVSGRLDAARLPGSGEWMIDPATFLKLSAGFYGIVLSEGDIGDSAAPVRILHPSGVLGVGGLASPGTPSNWSPANLLLDANTNGESHMRLYSFGALFVGGNYEGGYFTQDGPTVEGPGTRLMWEPKRAAFRAGHVTGTQWDRDNIGNFSAGFGLDVTASGAHSTAFGNATVASGDASFAAGDHSVASGNSSIALGYYPFTSRPGSFVFADRSTAAAPPPDPFYRAEVDNSANWRVAGGFHIYTSSNLSTGVTIQSGTTTSNWGQAGAVISTSTGAMLTTGGVWQNASDVARKRDFAKVDVNDILHKLITLPISTWSYVAEGRDVRRIGPSAQDFKAAFGFGQDDRSIGTVDADGVAMAAAQALERRSAQLQAEIADLRAINAALLERLVRLEERLER